jgi:hypothetical protein
MRVAYMQMLPPAQRLATLAITMGVIYAIVDLFAQLVRKLDRDPTRIPQRSSESERMVFSQRKGIAMKKLITTAIAATVLLSTTSLADTNDALTHEMPAISNALEIAIGGGYMRSAGDIGRGHAAVDDYAEGGGGAEVAVMYRMSSHLAIGLYGTLSGYNVGHAVAPTTDLAIGATAGVKADWHFRPHTRIDPWVSIGAGWRALWLGADEGTERTLQGIEMTRVQLGVDYRITPTFALAPYIGASAAMFLAEDTMTANGYDEISSNEVNWTFTAGLLARFDVPFGTY